MARSAISSKPFRPGTTGWEADDLLDPRIEAHWFRGRYEIVEGVLTEMPAAYFSGAKRLYRLQLQVSMYQYSAGVAGAFANDVDILIEPARVVRADAVWMTPEDEARQASAAAARPPGECESDPQRMRLLVPPTLVIESLSPGHEAHDRRTKRKWYAEFGVPHYWLFNPFERSLECLVLERASYRVDQAARGDADVRPALFPGLVVALAAVWSD